MCPSIVIRLFKEQHAEGFMEKETVFNLLLDVERQKGKTENSQQVNRTALSSKLPTGWWWYKLGFIVDRMKAIAVSYHYQSRWP